MWPALIYFVASAVLWWWAGMQIHLMGLLPSPGDRVGGNRRSASCRGGGDGGSPSGGPGVRGHAPTARPVDRWSWRGEQRDRLLEPGGPVRRGYDPGEPGTGAGGPVPVRGGDSPRWLRLRATAYERVTVDSWAPRPADRRQPALTGLVRLAQVADRSETTRLEIRTGPSEGVPVPARGDGRRRGSCGGVDRSRGRRRAGRVRSPVP